MLVSTIINDVAKELGDITMVAWTRSSLIGFLNQAVQQVVLVRPDSNSSTENFPLVAGTKQDLPVGGLRLLDVVRNMGAAGATPGKIVKFVSSNILDAFEADWHSSTPKAVTLSYDYDESVPDVFYNYPPAIAGNQLEIKVVRLPTALDTAMGDATFIDPLTVTGLKDIYSNSVMEWMFYKAYSTENSSQSSIASANTHMQSFYNGLGVKFKSDVLNSPEVKNATT